jgi:phosphoglycerate dehydrogenase-like enzyme
MGIGRIGCDVARIAKAFGMQTVAWSENLSIERAQEVGATLVSKHELLSQADIVTLHLRLSDRTRGIIGATELAMMKPTAFLINTARSQLVEEPALIDALRERRIAGAGLDVFDAEPLPAGHPFLELENTVITPHLGGVTRERYEDDYRQVVEDIQAWLNGTPIRVLNGDVLKGKNLRSPSAPK